MEASLTSHRRHRGKNTEYSIHKTYRHQNSEALGNNITKGKTELEDKSRLNLKGINHESPTKTQH